MKHRYRYQGPVLAFDRLIINNWSGETIATSEKKAKSNLCYKFKKYANLANNTRVSLPGKIKELEVII